MPSIGSRSDGSTRRLIGFSRRGTFSVAQYASFRILPTTAALSGAVGKNKAHFHHVVSEITSDKTAKPRAPTVNPEGFNEAPLLQRIDIVSSCCFLFRGSRCVVVIHH